MTAGQRHIEGFEGLIPMRRIQGNAGQRRRHLHAVEPGFTSFFLAALKQGATHAFPRKFRMSKERSDTRRLLRGIEHYIVPRMTVVAGSVEGASFAPAPTSSHLAANLGDIVRAVINKLL